MMKNVMKVWSVFLLLLFVFSCNLIEDETMTIPERIQAFEDDLNAGNYSSIQDHLHPEFVNNIDTYNDETSVPLQLRSVNAKFHFGTPAVTDNGNGTYKAVGSFQSDGGGGGSYTAVMKEDGTDNWKFISLTFSDGFELGQSQ